MNRTHLVQACLVTLILAWTGSLAHAKEGWTQSYQEALTMSKQTGKPILAEFTGSDWCPPCIRLNNEVFSQPEFKKWAQENVVLLLLDYPRRSPQANEIRQQNQQLLQKYGVRGFPTILFLDSEGEVHGRSGYMAGGPQAWTAQADRIIAGMPKREAIEFADDFDAAMKQAKEKKQALLIIAETPTTVRGNEARLQAWNGEREFVSFLNQRLVAVRVMRSGANATDADQVKAMDAIFKDLGVNPSATQVVLIDPNAEDKPKLLYRGTQLLAPGPMQQALAKDLPKIAYDGSWLEDMSLAKLIAAQDNKPIFIDFTGSDWCGYCIQMHRNVFTTEAWNKYAKENLVLVRIDFPRRAEQADSLKQQNRALAQQYGIRGFPTYIVLDSKGQRIGQLGYTADGPDAFVAQVQKSVSEKAASR